MRENWPSPKTTAWTAAEIEAFHRLYALRSQLAGFAARQAALRVRGGISPRALQLAYAEMAATARQGDYQAFLDADMGFHRAIAELAQIPSLLSIWKRLEREMKPFAGWAHRALFHDLEMIADAHTAQLEAIVLGKPAAAERAAHVDLDSLWQMLAEGPADLSDDPDPVERACAYILLNLHRKISLEKVAREVAHLSASHFNKLFRASRGEPLGVHVQNLRLRRAESLLREGEGEINEVAARVGYSDPSRFGEHFKRRYGCAPSEYAGRQERKAMGLA